MSGYGTIKELTFDEVQEDRTRHTQHLVYMGETTENGERHGWGVEYAEYRIDGKRASYEVLSKGMWQNNMTVTFGPETVQKRDTSLLESWGRKHLIKQCFS